MARLPISQSEKMRLRRLHRRSLERSDDRIRLFGRDSADTLRDITGQEIGKLTRAVLKERLTTDEQVAEEWRQEQRYRCMTAISALERLFLELGGV